MDQRGQAGGKNDSPLLPSFPLQPSAAGAEPAGLQPGEFVAAAGAAQANRELVADQLAAAAGEDRWTAGEACPLLLAFAGGEPSDETAFWKYGAADRDALASGGIVEGVAKKSLQSQEGTEGCLTKPDGKAATSSWGLALAQFGLCPEPWARPEKIFMRWNPSRGI